MEMGELELSVLRVLSVNTIFTEKNATSIRKLRENAALLLKWEGETVYTDRNGTRVVSNLTHPVLLPMGSYYEWHCTQAGRYTIVEFDTDFRSEEIIRLSFQDGERLRQRMQALELDCLHKKPYWQFKACAAVNELLFWLLTAARAEYVPSEKLERIKPAVEYMALHFNEPLSNEDLARLSGVSTVYFRKLFTAAYGISPIHYLHRIRIEKAKEMLRSDYGTLSNVATSVGYPNVFHFSKAFKQLVGTSPGAYARERGI